MAITVVETNSYASGGPNNRVDIHRAVTLTAAAAADVADGSTITAAALNFATLRGSPALAINSTGQSFWLLPKFDRSGYLTLKTSAFTPTDLVFKAHVIGR